MTVTAESVERFVGLVSLAKLLHQDKEALVAGLQSRREIIAGWRSCEPDQFSYSLLSNALQVISETEKHITELNLSDPTIRYGLILIDSVCVAHAAAIQYLLRTGRRTF